MLTVTRGIMRFFDLVTLAIALPEGFDAPDLKAARAVLDALA
jgi:hypothetical protein